MSRFGAPEGVSRFGAPEGVSGRAVSAAGAALASLLLLAGGAGAAPATCSYATWSWDARQQRAVDHRRVVVARAELPAAAIDATTGCSVCSEDQAWVEPDGLPRFQACRALAPQLRQAFDAAAAAGARIAEVIGYRVGATRGALDAAGRRTGFSNHSFGIALDVNPARNGLYHDCVEFGPACRLLRGGEWRPQDPLGLSRDHPLVRALASAGLRWGGEIAGRQKDFMHFSPSGY